MIIQNSHSFNHQKNLNHYTSSISFFKLNPFI